MNLTPRETLEATPGIEPGYTALQAAASPLRHVARGYCKMQQVNEAVYKWLGRECNWFLSWPALRLWLAP